MQITRNIFFCMSTGHLVKAMISYSDLVLNLISFFNINKLQPNCSYLIMLIQTAQNDMLLTKLIHRLLNQLTSQRHLIIIE